MELNEKLPNEIRKKLAMFLETFPLYRKFELENVDTEFLFFLHGQPFNYYCLNEKNNQTFELSITPKATYEDFNNVSPRPTFGGFNLYSPIEPGSVLHFKAKCMSCKKYHIDFLIALEGDNNVPDWNEEPKKNISSPWHFIKKIGQFPPYEIAPDKKVLEYLTEEDGVFYKKALMNYSQGYGVGAFAYFRRIIENEIKRIAKDFSQLDYDGSSEIIIALSKYEKDHQMINLIEALTSNLPPSFNNLGNNPVKLLYEQLSGGLHEFSEETCLEKSHSVDMVLKYIINKINEEKNEIHEVKNAMKNLSK